MKAFASAILLPSLAFAGSTVVVAPPPPTFADFESCAQTTIVPVSSVTAELLSVRVEFSNAATNQMEVWFCTDDAATRSHRDLLIGMDCGQFFASGQEVEGALFDDSQMSPGRLFMDVSVRSRPSVGCAVVNVEVGGVPYGFAQSCVAAADPFSWRSVKVFSRGLSGDMPSIAVSKERIGTTVRLR